jgi:hypothetical protein
MTDAWMIWSEQEQLMTNNGFLKKYNRLSVLLLIEQSSEGKGDAGRQIRLAG